jgi:hypothetical protein
MMRDNWRNMGTYKTHMGNYGKNMGEKGKHGELRET